MMWFQTGLVLISLCWMGCCCLVCAEANDRPGLILMMGDDHGWEETGYNGHPHVKTPVLDEMARTGLRLDRFYAAHPNCSPTRAQFSDGPASESHGDVCSGLVISAGGDHYGGTFAAEWLPLCAFRQVAYGAGASGFAGQPRRHGF